MGSARVVWVLVARRWLVILGVLALGGCSGNGNPRPSATEDAGPARQRTQTRLIESAGVVCAVGERPRYFVPGLADSPPALLGCARLGVSGKLVEFSGNLAHIDGKRHACVNPAYNGRGQRGLYIPAICKLEPPVSRFAVRDAGQPRQGVRGYEYVIWGTAGASADVVASFTDGTAQAAVFRVGPGLARDLSEPPFSLFVMELPLAAACGPVTVVANGPDATERIPPHTRLCERARDFEPGASRGSRDSAGGPAAPSRR